MRKIDDANNFRRTVVGLCLIAAPLVMILSYYIYWHVLPSKSVKVGDRVHQLAIRARLHLASGPPGRSLWDTLSSEN